MQLKLWTIQSIIQSWEGIKTKFRKQNKLLENKYL